jgi:3-oxoacyl-[acyl-carrier-protein] synthase-3
MALLSFKDIGIAGIAAAVPRQVINNYEHDKWFRKEDIKEVIDKIGVKERRFADEKTCSSDLCFAAAEKLISEMNINKEEIDLLIFISQTPDYRMPATSVLLQQRLGLSTGTITLDINLGCSAFIYGLSVAYSMRLGDKSGKRWYWMGKQGQKYIHKKTEKLLSFLVMPESQP